MAAVIRPTLVCAVAKEAEVMRTSLSKLPSSFTPEQIRARANAAQAEAARADILLVSLSDPRLNEWERQFARNIMTKLTSNAMGRPAR